MDQYHSLPSYSGPCYGVLELCLKDILSCIKPSENDKLERQYTISELTTLVQSVENLEDAVVRPFGSFTSNLYTKWGDLDTSVELSHSSPSSTAKKQKQTALRGIMKVLQRYGIARNFTFIPNARVPLLKFESNHHNISCDVSVDNHVGWMKSKILLLISEVDERFRDMVLLTKEWAKAHHINDPKSGTLNSYSLCLLVIFFFQTCKPAILPPLKDIYEGNFYDLRGTWSTLERQIEDACAANIGRFKSFRQRNQNTLCQLLISFFDKFSEIERMSSEYAICTYTGQLERIDSNHRWMKKSYRLLVEDPFERPDNAARAVGFRELITISEAFTRTSQVLSSCTVLSDRNALLASLVRHGIFLQLKVDKESYYTALENQEKQQFPATAYATHAPAHQKPRSSQLKVGANSHNTALGNLEKPQVAVTGYATSAYATDVPDPRYPSSIKKYTPRFRRSHKNSPVKVGSGTHYTAQGNKEKPQAAVISGYAVSAYATDAPDPQYPSSIKNDAPVHKRSHKNSPYKVGTETHYTARGNQEKPQFAVSGYVVSAYPTDSPVSEKSNKSPHLNAGTESHYTSKVNQKKPQFAFSGYATHAPVHNGSNKISQRKDGTQNHYTAQGNQEKPQLETAGYAANAVRVKHQAGKLNQHTVDLNLNLNVPEVVVSGVQVMAVDKHNQPSTVTQQRQRYANVPAQQVWRPRNSNK